MQNLPNDWPVWLVVTLLLINIFREPLSALVKDAVPQAVQEHFRHRASREADREEFEQNLTENTLGADLQSNAYREMRQQLIDQELVELVNTQLEYILNDAAKSATDRASVIGQILETQARQHRAILRVADLLGVVYSAIRKQNGGLMLQVSADIESVLDGQTTESDSRL